MKTILYSKKILWLTSLLWFVCQIIYIKLNKYDALVSDPGTYVVYARTCTEQGTMYPNTSQLHSSYIFNPGWINFIILWIKIFGSTRYLAYINAVFNVMNLWLVWHLCRSLFSNGNIAYTAAYMYMLHPSFFSITNHLYSELYFILLSTAALYFASRNGRYAYLAGISTALAMWTRPLALGWIVGCLFWFLWKRLDWRCAGRYVASYAAACLLIAVCTHRNYPDYVYKSTTGGGG